MNVCETCCNQLNSKILLKICTGLFRGPGKSSHFFINSLRPVKPTLSANLPKINSKFTGQAQIAEEKTKGSVIKVGYQKIFINEKHETRTIKKMTQSQKTTTA